MKNYTLRYLLFCSLSIFVLNCGKGSGDVAPENEIVTIAGEKLEYADKGEISNVEKQTNTTEIGLSDMKTLESYDDSKMVFDGNPAVIAALESGKVVLFEGHSLRKIIAVSSAGGKTTVSTKPANFNEYYKSANVSFEKHMYWTASNLSNSGIRVANGKLRAVTGTEDGPEFSGTISGWELSLKLTPEGGSGRKLNIEMTAKKGKAGLIEAKGFISDFSANSEMNVSDGNLDSYNHEHNNLNGELEVKYAILKMSEVAQISIPVEVSRTILVNGIIPVTFKLRCTLKVFPEVADNSTCQAHLKMTYDGSQGFSYSNRSIATAGTIRGFDVTRLGDTGSASDGIVGVGVGLEFPRFQIGVFGTVVVPYILNNTSVTSYFESGLPFVPGPCNQTIMKLKGVAGLDLSFFAASFKASKDLYEKKSEWKSPGSNCPAAFADTEFYDIF